MTDASQTLAAVRLLAQRHCTPAVNPGAHNLAHKILAALNAEPLPAALDAQDAAHPRRVDRAAGIIYGVKITSHESANGQEYSRAALRYAIHLFEGAPVNIDHPAAPDDVRRAADRFGQLRNVREECDGLYADLVYLTSHPMAARVAEAADKFPTLYGLSSNMDVRAVSRDGRAVVVDILLVRSVDIVTDPASVRGLFS